MTTLLPYVIRIPGPKRDYYYFRYGTADRASDDRKRIRLPGRPGSREFLQAYDALVAAHLPAPVTGPGLAGLPVGSLGWAIAHTGPSRRNGATRRTAPKRFMSAASRG
jgi:hypothetical protein